MAPLRTVIRRWLGVDALEQALARQETRMAAQKLSFRAELFGATSALAKELIAMKPTTTHDVIPAVPDPPQASDPHMGRW